VRPRVPADAPSLRWLAQLTRDLDGIALGVLCAVRSGEPPTDPGLLAELLAAAPDPAGAAAAPRPTGGRGAGVGPNATGQRVLHQCLPRRHGRQPVSAEPAAEFIDGYGVLILPTTGRYLHIPYRALLPRGVRNLLVAGRAIGGDRIAHAATRNMACCAVTGQAAGIAAALSVRTGQPFHELDAGLVQGELDRQGVRHQ
jgi:FAD-dependent oxidoreductase family protein